MSTEAETSAPTRRRGDPGASGPGLALAQSGKDDDTGYDYDDTPSGSIGRPGAEPGQTSGNEPGRPGGRPAPRPRSGGRAAGRVAALLFPSLIVRTWHHRPGRGSVCPDKETP
jgi:hypothetical protein